jgi:general secretion pathway protein F
MPAFEYVALDARGKRTKGLVSAETGPAARAELRRRQLSPLKIARADARQDKSAGSPLSSGPRLTGAQRVLVTRQLATLVSAGLPVAEALGAVAGQGLAAGPRRIVLGLRARVVEGERLSLAMAGYPGAFPPLYRALIAAGETTGALGAVMERLAEHLEKSAALSRRITLALIYPSALGFTALAVIAVLMVAIVPRIAEQFGSMGVTLPLLTRIMIGTSEFLQSWWPGLLALVVALPFAVRLLAKRPAIRARLDRLVLSLPLIGGQARKIEAARFSRTTAVLLASGVVLPDALRAAWQASANTVFRQSVARVREAVEGGRGLPDALQAEAILPPLALHMVAAGDRAGDPAAMLARAAVQMETEIDGTVSVALSLLEPAIIIAMGGVVAVIVLSILLPILQLNTLAMG